MSRIVKNPAVVLLVATLSGVFAPGLSHGQSGLSPLIQPQSHAFGKSFAEGNVLYSQ